MKTPSLFDFLCLVAIAVLLCFASIGCATTGTIRTKSATVRAVPDAGKPATLNTGEVRTGFRIPAKSRLTVTRSAATPTAPAVEVSTFDFSEPTEFEQVASTLRADTGTIDTSVAKHRIDADERRWLLWAAISVGLAGLVIRSLLPAWPSLSNGLLMGAALAFAAWKFAEIPAWLWAVAIGICALMALGYKRAEWDANKDGIPDVLQRTP